MSGHRLTALGACLLALLAAGGLAGCDARGAGGALVSAPAVVENFALLDHQGRFRELHYHDDAPAIVLMVHGSGCPIVRGSIPALEALAGDYGPRGVIFWLINASPQDDRRSVAAEAEAWGIDLPILIDDAQLVRASLGLERTAEVLVIDPKTWRIVYRGGLDDRLDYEAQKGEPANRAVATVLDHLLDAPLEAPLEARAPAVEPLPVRGCLILDEGAEAPLPSYAHDIAPILIRRCAGCHRPEGVGPWAMTDYQTVRGWSPMMREVIRTRRMPPWHADPEIGHFSPDLSLDAGEARAIVHWSLAGAPRGDGEDPLPAAVTAAHGAWPIGEPDLVLDMPEQSIPESGVLDYRYIDLAIPPGGPLFVRAVDLRPSNRAVLHHALAHVIYPAGHPRHEQHWQNEMFAGYAPGIDNHPFPAGTGRQVPAGAMIRVELHYITTGRPETDRPQLAIYLSDAPAAHELHTRGPAQRDLEIPPGDRDHRVEARWTVPQDAVLYSFLPHMHYRGSWMRYEAVFPGGRRELLLSVPNYRFTWQRYYVLTDPLPLPAGTEIVVTGSFDNSPQNPFNPDPTATVRWGSQSFDEMFIGYMDYAFQPLDAAGPTG